ncbi:MAG: hypothetical protein ACRDD8_10985 [Bacteroidales bacterium]
MANYVKNADLRKSIIDSKINGKLSDEAIEMLTLMANKYASKLSYAYDEDRQDCISHAILDCLLYWERYDETKSDNAFAYFTQIIKNGFAKGWRKNYGNLPKSKKISISNNSIYNF